MSASNENIVYWINFHNFHHQACETEDDILRSVQRYKAGTFRDYTR